MMISGVAMLKGDIKMRKGDPGGRPSFTCEDPAYANDADWLDCAA